MAWQAEQLTKCTGCGRPKSETFDPDSPVDYEAIALRCRACEARDTTARKFQSEGDPAGIYVAVLETERHLLGG